MSVCSHYYTIRQTLGFGIGQNMSLNRVRLINTSTVTIILYSYNIRMGMQTIITTICYKQLVKRLRLVKR